MQETTIDITTYAFGLLADQGPNVVVAIVILIAGWWLAERVRVLSSAALKRSGRVDEMLCGFLSSVLRYVVIIFTLLAVLDRFGVQTTSIIAVLGAAGLAIGLAMQGMLSNVASGVMVLFLRPFKVEDYIEAGGHGGTVKAVSLFVTHIRTADNVEIIIPNNQLWNNSIKNFSFNATRRLDLSIGIGYGDEINAAMFAINAVIAADTRVMAEPEPLIAVGNLGESSVDLIIRVWCERGEYLGLKGDLLKALKERFDADGITIPFPQRDLHIHQTEGT